MSFLKKIFGKGPIPLQGGPIKMLTGPFGKFPKNTPTQEVDTPIEQRPDGPAAMQKFRDRLNQKDKKVKPNDNEGVETDQTRQANRSSRNELLLGGRGQSAYNQSPNIKRRLRYLLGGDSGEQ